MEVRGEGSLALGSPSRALSVHAKTLVRQAQGLPSEQKYLEEKEIKVLRT